MPDRLRLPSVRWSVWLRCLCASECAPDGQLLQCTLCSVHTLGSLTAEAICGEGERGRSEEEEEEEREEGWWKNRRCIHEHLTPVLELHVHNRHIQAAHMETNFCARTLNFLFCTEQRGVSQT